MYNQLPVYDEDLKCGIFSDIFLILDKLDYKVYYDIDWADLTNRTFAILGTTVFENMYDLRNRFHQSGFTISEIETPLFEGFCFDTPSRISGLFLAPIPMGISHNQEDLNTDRDSTGLGELKLYGINNSIKNLYGIDYSSLHTLSKCLDFASAQTLRMTYTKYKKTVYLNTHKEYLRHYHLLKITTDSIFETQEYRHIQFFSAIYYMEIKIISELSGNNSLSIHDVGTNTAHLPLLMNELSKDDMFGSDYTDIYASDFDLTSATDAIEIAGMNQLKRKICFLTIDLTGNIDDIPKTDIVILNDVLEHLPNGELSLSALKKLWGKANIALIAHVPFEQEINRSWDHHILFNEDKLRDWAGQLPESILISDNYYNHNMPLTSYGFLIVKRQNNIASIEA